MTNIKRIFLMTSLAALALSACAGQQQQNLPPTISPQDIQNTAAAAAFTMIAATQLAQPTATLIPPPTETPFPTETPMPTFTAEFFIPTPELLPPLIEASPTPVSILNSGTGVDECNRILSVADAGPLAPVRVQNMTGGVVTLSLYLSKNDFGQCGYMPNLPQTSGSYTVQAPLGSWSFFALIDYGKGKSGQSYGGFVLQSGGTTIKIIAK